jgi:hypothetical protein
MAAGCLLVLASIFLCPDVRMVKGVNWTAPDERKELADDWAKVSLHWAKVSLHTDCSGQTAACEQARASINGSHKHVGWRFLLWHELGGLPQWRHRLGQSLDSISASWSMNLSPDYTLND